MLLMGAVFQCLGPALTISAALAHRDPFVLPLEHKEEADDARRRFAGDSRSDHIALLKAFEGWQAAKREGRERNYCWENFLSVSTLQMMEDMRRQFLDLLSDIGFIDKSRGPQSFNQYSQDLEMVRAVLCAGLFPSVVQCKARGKRTAFFTKEDGKVEPHPSSVNARVNSFPQPWLVYSEKVKTTGIYVRDSTNLSDYALLMFGGSLTTSKSGQGVEMLDGYLQFQASKKTTQLVQVCSH
jgi:ATP-dependent RNA helicase DHX36